MKLVNLGRAFDPVLMTLKIGFRRDNHVKNPYICVKDTQEHSHVR